MKLPNSSEFDHITEKPRSQPQSTPNASETSQQNGYSELSRANVTVKAEDDVQESAAGEAASTTETTLRSNPLPSIKRRESEAAESSQTPELSDKSKKRKRGTSPPWTFPSVDQATAKTVDGRRISTRVNTNTPVLSETEDVTRARSASQSGRSRPPSPPWRKFTAEGPTSLQVDGVRKSGRVNKELSTVPKRTSPRSKKQEDKPVLESKPNVRPMSRGKGLSADGSAEAAPKKGTKTPREQSPRSRIADLQAQIAALQPTRSFPSPEAEIHQPKANHKRKRSDEELERKRRTSSPTSTRKSQRPSVPTMSPEVTRPSPRIKLRLNASRQVVPTPHPQAIGSPPARPPKLSLYQVIETFELKEMQQPYMENERGPPNADWFQQKNERLAAEEGTMRRRILEAAQPGGALSKEVCSIFEDEAQDEPPRQYAHVDHLVNHALYFRQLQVKEKVQHRALAKKVAYEALEKWKKMRGPTEEDLRAEADKIFRLIYRQVVSDVRSKWEMVEKHVQQLRHEQWQREEEARREAKLQRQLEHAEAMVARQRGEGDESDVEMEDGSIGDVDESGSEDEDDDSSEENMSESESEAGSEDESEFGGEMTEAEREAYLAATQVPAEPPDKGEDVETDADETIEEDSTRRQDDRDVGPMTDMLLGVDGASEMCEEVNEQVDWHPDGDEEDGMTPFETAVINGENSISAPKRTRRSQSVAENVDEMEVEANLSDDESEEMYDSDEDMSDSDDDAEAGSHASADDDQSSPDGSEAVETSMLGFLFGAKELKTTMGLPTPTTSAEGEGDVRDRTADLTSDDNADRQAEAGALEAEHDVRDETLVQAEDGADDTEIHDGEANTSAPDEAVAPTSVALSPSIALQPASEHRHQVPLPTLLRGTLRSYQHAGLDWLASLYRNNTNGILADEMGLGKTIQTIALLAHLAEERQVWETHLIIVPTSVILNWVTEFKKFLPGFRVLGYYGNSEERNNKRKGWINDPHHQNREKRGYNVVITSYNVAIQDINAIRTVQWHYLVLDEAHNIRNFHSQRWQMLIRLKTRARLLLTGTPLQNSLTELWSLLTFLTAGDDDPAHGDLEGFLSNWKEPVKEIFDAGVKALSTDAQRVVDQLHISLRPFLLRRLKSEVEKDLPKKTESVVVCKLSKRQRQLYQEYMGLASTRESLAKGNAISAGNVLLNLRRVCNHPDMFDPRPIQTSFAMEKSPVGAFAVKESLIRDLLGDGKAVPPCSLLAAHEGRRGKAVKRSRHLAATGRLQRQITELETATSESPDLGTIAGCRALQRLRQREKKLQQLRDCLQITTKSLESAPVYGIDLRELLTVRTDQPYRISRRQGRQTQTFLRAWPAFGQRPLSIEHRSDLLLAQSTSLQEDVLTLGRLGDQLKDTITRFAFCTPVATASVLDHLIPPGPQQLLRASGAYPQDLDYAHEARIRTSIVFPDARLLIYDSGKLQRLTTLLRDLQARGSRSLIFTQMKDTLNILEHFLNLLNLPYLRLDGSTTVENRQLYSSEFNRPDSKYQCMILSSRAGGVGLNLTGASSVIFYDLDWNPQMDRQCMDRAHRIGQVRDVEVYKMVSEKTVEENILRKASQKSLLDQAVIQEGHFTTEYQRPKQHIGHDDKSDDDVDGAIDRYLGGGDKTVTQAMKSVEDSEDVAAAEKARNEEVNESEEFTERSSKGPSLAATPGPGVQDDNDDDGVKGHIDGFMIRLVQEMWNGVPFVPPPPVRRLDSTGRDRSHRSDKKRKRR